MWVLRKDKTSKEHTVQNSLNPDSSGLGVTSIMGMTKHYEIEG